MKIFAKTWGPIVSGVLIYVYLIFGLVLTPERAMAGSCAAPTLNYLNDGLGADIDYFDKRNQLAANWEFNNQGCPILEYKFRIIKRAGTSPWEQVTNWMSTADTQIKVNIPPIDAPFLVEGETYFFKVMARNSTGWSEKYRTDGQMLDTSRPRFLSFSLSQNKPYGGRVALSWLASDLGSGIKNYQIYRNGAPLNSVLDKSVLSFTDTIFGDSSTYTYYLVAIDGAGNSSASRTLLATVDDVAPTAPAISYLLGEGKITIFWPQVANASIYKVYRNGVLVQTGAGTTYTDTDIIKGETYQYAVYALDVAGNQSSVSNILEIYLPKPRVSSIKASQVLGEMTGAEQAQAALGEERAGEEQVQAEEVSTPEETAEEAKTNWSLIIAIIIAAAIVISGVLYWWYAREDEEEDKI